MPRPIAVKSLEKHRIWIEYDDGVSGEVDLSYLAGRGVFRLWNEEGAFGKVELTRHRSIAWSDEVELCPDALYLEIP